MDYNTLRAHGVERPSLEQFRSGDPKKYFISFKDKDEAKIIQGILIRDLGLSWKVGGTNVLNDAYGTYIMINQGQMFWSCEPLKINVVWTLNDLKSYVTYIEGVNTHEEFNKLLKDNKDRPGVKGFSINGRTVIKFSTVEESQRVIEMLCNIGIAWLGGPKPPNFGYDSIFVSRGSAAWYQVGRNRDHPTDIWSMSQFESYHDSVVKIKSPADEAKKTTVLDYMQNMNELNIMQSVGRIRVMKSVMRLGMSEEILLL